MEQRAASRLLSWVSVLAMLGWLLVTASHGYQPWLIAAGLLVLCLLPWGLHLASADLFPVADRLLLIPVWFLSASGVTVLAGFAPQLATRQLLWLLLGALALFVSIQLRWERLGEYGLGTGVSGAALLALATFWGKTAGGARSWLQVGGLVFQPTEAAKVAFVAALAALTTTHRKATVCLRRRCVTLSQSTLLLPMVVAYLALLGWQRDLGTALLLYVVYLTVHFIAHGSLSGLLAKAALGVLGGSLLLNRYEHLAPRVVAWLQPWQHPASEGYQTLQALYAVGSGGTFGVGLGRSPAHLLPAAGTDLLFAVWTEETGLIGALAILSAYVFLLSRLFRTALFTRASFPRLFIGGLGALLGWQAFTITAGILRLLPLTGVTFPFFSYGGSSIIASFVSLGAVIRFSALSCPGRMPERDCLAR